MIPTWHHLCVISKTMSYELAVGYRRTLCVLGKDTSVDGDDTLQDSSKSPNLVCRWRSKVLQATGRSFPSG